MPEALLGWIWITALVSVGVSGTWLAAILTTEGLAALREREQIAARIARRERLRRLKRRSASR